MRKVFLIPLLMLLLIPTSTIFAANPTINDEWDFDILDVKVYQNPENLENMIIKVDVINYGNNDLGTVDINATVTGPDGEIFTEFGTLRDIQKDHTRHIILEHRMSEIGTYDVSVNVMPPKTQLVEHIFDQVITSFTIDSNLFERNVNAVGTESNDMVTYTLENPSDIEYFEIVHVVINLPEEHTYGGISVTNDEFAEDFSIDTKDIYLESTLGFANMNVNLVNEDNLLPRAGAQNTLQEYVTFYVMNKDACSSHVCVNIDHVEEEFPLWILGLVAVGIGGLAFYINNKRKPTSKTSTTTNNKIIDLSGYYTEIKTPNT